MLNLFEFHVFKHTESEKGKSGKGHKSSKHSKKQDVADIVEKFLPVHIESRCKDDRRQHEIEEQLSIKSHNLSKLLRAVHHVDRRNNNTNHANQASFVTKFEVNCVLYGFKESEAHQHGKDDNDALVENFVAILFYVIVILCHRRLCKCLRHRFSS